MSVALAPSPDAAGAAEAAEAASCHERRLAILGGIAEIGLSIAREIESQLAARQIAPEKAAIAYGRVARAVRLTVALQSRLIAEARDPAPTARDRDRAERRARIVRIVGRAIDADTLDATEAVHQKREAADRLEHDDIYGDLLSRPASEIVAQVCRDLGVAPDWARLAAEAWAREEIAAGAPGVPLSVAEWPPCVDDEDLGEGFGDEDFEDEDDLYAPDEPP